MATVRVNPGICGLKSTITAASEDFQIVNIDIESDCPDILAMAEEIKQIDAFTECFVKPCQGQVYAAAQKHCKHAACPVPSAVIKAVEVAAELALPSNIEFDIQK